MPRRNIVDILLRAKDQASGPIRNVKDGIDGLGPSSQRARGSVASLTQASTAAAIALGAAAAAAAGAGLAAVRLAGQFEQAELAFTTMLGSGERAKAFLDDLADFAAATPFDFQGLQNSSRLLLAFGFQAEAAIPIVNALGDATAALGGGTPELEGIVRAIGQIQTKGKVSTEELLQLAERGIPAFDILKERLGLTGDQISRIGELGISSTEAITALLEGLSDRFGGAMELQSKSLLGLWSSVKDNISLITTDIGLQLVETFDLKGLMERALAQLDRIREWAKNLDLKELLAEHIDAVYAMAGAITGTLIPSLLAAARSMVRLARQVVLPLAGLAIAGALVVDVARQLGVDFSKLALPDGALARVAMVLMGLVDVFRGVSTSIAALIRAVVVSVKDWLEFFRLAADEIGDFFETLGGIAESLVGAFEQATIGNNEQAARLLEQAGTIAKQLKPPDIRGAWNEAFQGLPDEIVAKFVEANGLVTQGWGKIRDGFAGEVSETANATVAGITNAITEGANKLTDWQALLGGGLEDVVGTVPAAADAAGKETKRGVEAAGVAWLEALERIAGDVAKNAQVALGLKRPDNAFYDTGVAIVDAIKAGLESAWPDLATRIAAGLDAIGVNARLALQAHVQSGAALRVPAPSSQPLGPGAGPAPIGLGRFESFDTYRERFLENLDELSLQLGRRAQREKEAADAAARAALFTAAQAKHGTASGQEGLAGTTAADRTGGAVDADAVTRILRDTVQALVDSGAPLDQIQTAVDALTAVTPMSVAQINSLTNGVLELGRQADSAARHAQRAAEFNESPFLFMPEGGLPPAQGNPRALVTPGFTATVPAPVPLGTPDFTATVAPDRSHLDPEVLEQILVKEMLERQKVIDQLTTMSTENGPIANLGAALANVASKEVPAFGAALDGFVQAGPMGAVIGALVQLASQSEGFQQLLAMVNAALEPLVDALGSIFEAIMPVVEPLLELAGALFSVVGVIAKLIAPPLQFLGNIISAVVDGFIAVWNFLLGWIPGLHIDRPDLTPPDEETTERDARIHSDQPPSAPDPNLGALAPALQLGLATPLRQAADIMLQAAQLDLRAAEAEPILSMADGFGGHVDRFGQHVDRLGAYIETLTIDGIRIDVTSLLAGRAAPGLASAFTPAAALR